jgi:hypothetical protein
MAAAMARILARGRLALLLAGAWLVADAAWGQRAPPTQSLKEVVAPSYALEYGVVLFVVLAGLAVVFRPSRRADPEDEIRLPFSDK